MADDSFADNFIKTLLGVGAGFGLFYLATHFGLGGHGRGEGPAQHPTDVKRLVFVMTFPNTQAEAHAAAGFQQRTDTGLDSKIFSVDDLIARVREGGRGDVELRASGAALQGAWQEARDRVKRSGLAVFEVASTPAVSGFYGRGYYGAR